MGKDPEELQWRIFKGDEQAVAEWDEVYQPSSN